MTDEKEMAKLKYEVLEARFQAYCKHDGGRTGKGDEFMRICAICGWDTTKCQHRKADAWDKHCRECGAKLMGDA
ncbi:hypothetical protein ACUY4Q_003682 [Phytobacter sp. AG2a]